MIVKNIYGSAYTDNRFNVFVESISGAKAKCMKSYVIPATELEPEVIVINCGTNYLRKEAKPDEIANEIVNLSIKAAKNEVAISEIVRSKDW